MKKSDVDPLSELQTTRFKDDDWILPKRYKINGLVGSGAYGSVVSATDLRTGEEVAIKRNRDIFKSLEQDYNAVTPTESLPKAIVPTNRSCISQLRVLRELKVLLHAKHENIVKLLEVVLPPSFEQFSDVYIVTDLYEADLRDVLESPNTLDIDQVRYMMYQLLGAIQHLHDSDIVHRDLKPEVCFLQCF
jgi:mitogen-activated protein kinase 1/3